MGDVDDGDLLLIYSDLMAIQDGDGLIEGMERFNVIRRFRGQRVIVDLITWTGKIIINKKLASPHKK